MSRNAWIGVVFVALLAGAWRLFGPAAAAPAQSAPIHPDADLMIVETPPQPISAPHAISVAGPTGLCGLPAALPAIPQASDLSGRTAEAAHEVVLGSFKTIKAYQGSLPRFRECILKNTTEYRASLAEAKARNDAVRSSAVNRWMDALMAAYDKTIDDETNVVTTYVNLHNAYCKIGAGLKGCPRPQAND